MSNDLIPSHQLPKHQRSTKAVVSIIASSASVFFAMIGLVFVTTILTWNTNFFNLVSFDNQLTWCIQSAIVAIITGIIGALTASNAKIEIERSKGTLLGGRAARWALALGIIGAIAGFLELFIVPVLFFLMFFL